MCVEKEKIEMTEEYFIQGIQLHIANKLIHIANKLIGPYTSCYMA